MLCTTSRCTCGTTTSLGWCGTARFSCPPGDGEKCRCECYPDSLPSILRAGTQIHFNYTLYQTCTCCVSLWMLNRLAHMGDDQDDLVRTCVCGVEGSLDLFSSISTHRKDIEGVMAGAVIVKPGTAGRRFTPPLWTANVTVIDVKPDFSDFEVSNMQPTTRRISFTNVDATSNGRPTVPLHIGKLDRDSRSFQSDRRRLCCLSCGTCRVWRQWRTQRRTWLGGTRSRLSWRSNTAGCSWT